MRTVNGHDGPHTITSDDGSVDTGSFDTGSFDPVVDDHTIGTREFPELAGADLPVKDGEQVAWRRSR